MLHVTLSFLLYKIIFMMYYTYATLNPLPPPSSYVQIYLQITWVQVEFVHLYGYISLAQAVCAPSAKRDTPWDLLDTTSVLQMFPRAGAQDHSAWFLEVTDKLVQIGKTNDFKRNFWYFTKSINIVDTINKCIWVKQMQKFASCSPHPYACIPPRCSRHTEMLARFKVLTVLFLWLCGKSVPYAVASDCQTAV